MKRKMHMKDAMDGCEHTTRDLIQEAHTKIKHICHEHHGRLHKCMRCGLLFECETPNCQAQFKVLPSIIKDGQVIEHCPRNPDWDWIRDYGEALFDQARFCDGLETHWYGRCELRDSDDYKWRCHKRKGHDGACSCHNDCGEYSPNGGYCGFPPNHCGKHAWELI